jgi:glutamate synthase (NADPH/NADH) large chain
MSVIASFQQQVPQAPSGSEASDHNSCHVGRTAERGGVRPARGLYDPALDKDSCGVGFIADIKGRPSHQIVADALCILVNLEHRGAVGADPRRDAPG